MVVNTNIVVNYFCMCVQLYAKARKETETEEAIGFVAIIFMIDDISIGRGGGPAALFWSLVFD